MCFRLRPDGSCGERTALLGTAPGEAPAGGPVGDDAPRGPHAIVLSEAERYAIATEIAANRCRVLRFGPARRSR